MDSTFRCGFAAATLRLRSVCVALSALTLASAVQAEHYKPEEVGFVVNQKADVKVANGFSSSQAVAFGITPPIRDLAKAPPPNGKRVKDTGISNENEKVKHPIPGAGLGDRDFVDPLLAQNNTRAPNAMPAPIATYDGMTNAEACNCAPPDTNGDIGPNHYVQTVNVRVSIYDRTSGARVLGPSLQSSGFFGGLPAGNTCRTSDDGDPVVLYDPLADRWMISQFEVDDVPGHQCIAISVTNDPTGAYYAYDFVMPNSDFHDYPHYGVWPDGYYMADHVFNQAGTAYLAAGFFAFDRVKMLAGDPTAGYVYRQDANAGGHLPVDTDGFVPPPAGLPHRFIEFLANEFGSPADGLRVHQLVPNYANPGASTFTQLGDIPVAEFDARSPSSRSVVEQSGTANGLDAIADRLMFRLAYRNLGTAAVPVNSYVGNFSVNVSGVNPTSMATFQAGIRWFELRSSDNSLPTIRDQGTHNLEPGIGGAGGDNNFMGSMAQDAQGNLALGFTQSASDSFPDIMIAGRTGAGVGAGLNEGEGVFFASNGSQTGGGNRWGDYSSMSVDPNDECTFWYTTEYYAATTSSSWRTRFGKFVFPGCTTPARGFIAANVTDCNGGAPVLGANVNVSGGLFRQTLASGALQSNIPAQAATYTVTVSKANYSTFTDNAVVVTDGNTTTVNACIAGAPAIATAPPAVLVAESFLPANGAPDPTEVVTVTLPLKNTSTTNSTNLVATLQATGGVTLPSAAQDYGVVVGGGADVARDFTFTAAGNCGDVITLTLALQDGALDLGTVTYTLQLGTTLTTNMLSESFDAQAPALPAGWTTAITDIGVAFVASTTNPFSAPNTAYSPEVANVGTASLVSPSFNVPNGGGQISFRNLYNLEDTYDGMVLEIAINGGAFEDITTGGNAFVVGGYTDTISSSWSSPIAGRSAWSGLSGGTTAAPTYITSTINLPAAAAGQPVQLRWRSAGDSSVVAAGANGVRVDNVVVDVSSPVCVVPPGSNTAPNIAGPSDQNINEDGATGALNVTIGDTETVLGDLVMSRSSNNQTLVPDANIVLGGVDGLRTVTVTPAANESGTAEITITVTDGGGLFASTTFDVIVAAVNDAPTFTILGNRSHLVSTTGLQTVTSFVSGSNLGANEGGQTVLGYTVDETSDPNGIVSGAAIAANGTLTYTLTGVAGSATISAVMQDSGGTANGGIDSSSPVPFDIVVLPIDLFGNGFE